MVGETGRVRVDGSARAMGLAHDREGDLFCAWAFPFGLPSHGLVGFLHGPIRQCVCYEIRLQQYLSSRR